MTEEEVVTVPREVLVALLAKVEQLIDLCRTEEAPGEAAKSPTRPRSGPT
jgi:hypothetical protein